MNLYNVSVKWAIPFALTGLMRNVVYAFVHSFFLLYLCRTGAVTYSFAIGLIVAVKIFDILKEPFLGMLLDVAGSRFDFNKFKFFTLTGSLFNAILTISIFNIPMILNGLKPTYCLLTYILWTISISLFDLTYSSVISSFNSGNRHREILSSITRIAQVIGFCLPLILFSLFFRTIQDIQEKHYNNAAFIIALFEITFAFIYAKSDSIIQTKNKVLDFKHVSTLFFQNDQLMVTFVITLLQQIAMCVFIFSYELYVSKLDVQTPQDAFIELQMPWIVVGILCFALYHKLVAIFSRKSVFYVSIFMISTAYFLLFMINLLEVQNSVLTGLLLAVIAGGFALSLNSTTVMTADCVDYGEFRFGKRTECLCFSIQNISEKVGHLIAFLISGLTFSYADVFIKNRTISSQFYSISLDLIVVFSAMAAMLFIYMMFYKLHGSFFENILNAVISFGKESPKPAKDLGNAVRYAVDEHCIMYNLKTDSLEEVLSVLTSRMYDVRAISSKNEFLKGIKAKLLMNPAGIAHGIAIPHTRGSFVRRSALAVAHLSTPIDCGAADGKPCDLIFLIAAPDDGRSHISLLGNLSLMLSEPGFADKLRKSTSPEEINTRLITCEKQLFK